MDCRREVFRKLRLALAYYIKLGQELCFHNGGIYIKLGQHIVQLEYVLPQEYVQTMRESMLKRCPVSSYEDVQGVFKKEIGELPETVFAEFDPVPLASASLAQVHAATTHDGKKVAVKVQHDHLLDTSVIDIATVDLVVNALNYIFHTFDYRFRYADGLPLERYSP